MPDNGSLRVLLVLATSTGGVGRHVAAVAAGLRSRGQSVSVAGPVATNERFGFSGLVPGVVFVPVEIASGLRPLADLRAAWRLRRVVREADVVHAHGVRAGTVSALARTLGGGTQAAFVVSWHNALLGSRAQLLLGSRLQRWLARRADIALGVSSDLVRELRAYGARQVEAALVAVPAGQSALDSAEARTAARAGTRAALGIEAGRFCVLAVGRLHPQKGFDVLVEAASILARRSSPDAGGAGPTVLIAGDGPARAELETLITRSAAPVRLLGDRADVAELLQAADVVVMASRWEGWPLAAAEALAGGRPLVVSDVGGLPELVGDAALLVHPGDAEGLADAVARVLREPDLAADLEVRALRRAATLPDDCAVVEQLMFTYGRARSSHGRRRGERRQRRPRRRPGRSTRRAGDAS